MAAGARRRLLQLQASEEADEAGRYVHVTPPLFPFFIYLFFSTRG